MRGLHLLGGREIAAAVAVGKWESRSDFQGGAAPVFSTAPGRLTRELRRRAIPQAAVRPVLVVLLPPGGDLPARLEQVPEPAHIQALLPHPPVKTLHASVLHRSSWLNVHQLDLLLDAPRQEVPTR